VVRIMREYIFWVDEDSKAQVYVWSMFLNFASRDIGITQLLLIGKAYLSFLFKL
jgi:hypothetical protein